MGRRPVVHVGDVFDLRCGSKATVTEYLDRNQISVVTSSGYKTKCSSMSLRKGNVADRLHPSVLGIGVIGVGNCGRKFHNEAYVTWCVLLKEVNSGIMSIKKEWLNFQVFAKWFYESSGWTYGMILNSTLMSPGKKIHSKDTTIMIPKWLNSLLYGRSRNGNCAMPKGYALSHGRYRSRLKVKKEIIHCVSWDTIEEAEEAYIEAKSECIREAMDCGELPIAIHGGLEQLIGASFSECI